ncbi:MAG: hypothetical protein ACM3JL_01330 [Nitrososphaerota archaeon]
MEAGEEREALAKLADRLCAEFGYPADAEVPDEAHPQLEAERAMLFGDLLGPEDEELVATARAGLARIAAALGTRHPKVVSETAYGALLDGAELVMRGELASGKPVPRLMPGFVFLLALPMVSHDEALELSQRTSSLLGEPAA